MQRIFNWFFMQKYSCNFWMWKEDYEEFLRDIGIAGMKSDPEIYNFKGNFARLGDEIEELKK
jgi:hypothetical protein